MNERENRLRAARFEKPDHIMNYAPSLYHQALMRDMRPALSWRGQPVADWQADLRGRLAAALGFNPPPADRRVALNARTLWRRDHELGTIEKIVFTAEEHVDVPCYLCLPKNAVPPYTWFICLQGHTTGMHYSIAVAREHEAAPLADDDDHDFGLICMRRGIAALCLEQRSFGERGETIQPQHLDYLCHQAAMNALLLGTTLLAERVFDIDRAIDYLLTRKDCDPHRLGVMGTSGGGTASLYAGALLPRLRYVMPSCCFSTFQASIQSTFHCVCNYVPGLLPVAEMGDIAGLIAPRPLVLVSGREDGIFPLGPAQTEFARVQEIYRAAGAPDRCDHVIGEGGHRFYADAAWNLFIEKHGKVGNAQEAVR